MVIRLLVVCALAACRIDSIDLTGKPCPCPSGWLCDPVSDTCQRELPPDQDGAVDVPLTDAGFDLLTGLVVHFPFDQTAGQAILDAAPAARHGWAYSAAETMWTTGKVGGGMRFNGTGYASHVLFPSTNGSCGGTVAIAGSVTISAWVRFDSFHPWNTYTMGDIAAMHGTSGGNEGGWGLGATDGCGSQTAAVSVAPPNNATRANRCGTTTLVVDTWYHLTGVYDAGERTLDIYVDGVQDNGPLAPGSAAIPASIQVPPQGCPYVAASYNQDRLLHGTVDELRLYARALTAAEIAELYRISQ